MIHATNNKGRGIQVKIKLRMKVTRHIIVACLSLLCLGLLANANAQTSIIGTGVGPIPDGTAGICGAPSLDLVVSFNAPAFTAITDVQVDIDMEHTWLGDLRATLVAPDGDQHVLFSNTGSVSATGCGDSSDLDGVYEFSDSLPATEGNWWDVALTGGASDIIPPGVYRATEPGGVAGATGLETNITNSFDAIYPAGTWQLLVSDGGLGDIGSVNAATLIVTETTPLESLSCNPKPCLKTAGPSNGSAGIFFDITAYEEDIIIKSIDFFNSSFATEGKFQLFNKAGSYKGFESDATAWQGGAIRTLSGVSEQLNYVAKNETIKAGETRGFVLLADRSFSSVSVRYRDESVVASQYTATKDVVLFSDTGLGSSGTGSPTDLLNGGNLNIPRTFAGTIYYQVGEDQCYVAVTQNNNPVTFCL